MATTLVLETKILPNDQFYLVNSIITDDQIKILESCKDLIEGIEINKDFSLGENETFQKFNDCLRNIEKTLDNLNVDDDKKKIEIKEEISKLNDELSKLLGVKDKKEAGEDTQAVNIKPEHILDIDPPIIRGSRKQVVQKLYVRVRKVAEKSISSGKQYVDGPEFIKLKEEIGFLKKLSELLYLISQWGEYNLKTILAERPGRLSWSEKLSISHGIANAIKFCHDQNILHYDLQSDNIFLDLHFQPKLYNFRTEKESPIILKSANDPVDERWSAPERLNGKEYTKANRFGCMSCPKAVPTCEPVCNTGNETCIVTAKRCFSCPRAMCRSTKDESCLKCLMYPECKPCADDEMCVIEEPNCYSCGSATCVKKSLGCVYCTMMMPTCPPCHESYRCQIVKQTCFNCAQAICVPKNSY
ncbi:16289_t:CDS:2 [Entrophospora sp. SA101]|nr:16289_t:CDS:2 [Entrophospora sp. SA101]